MVLREIPVVILGLTVCAYWFCVGVMMLRVRRQTRGLGGAFVPALRREQLMWLIWVPLIVCWMVLPFASLTAAGRASPLIGFPSTWADRVGYHLVRFLAAGAGIVCLLLSIWCWGHMGRHWRMGVDPTQQAPLLTRGPFAKVRHPIYGLSILLMLMTGVILPAPAVMLMAAVHISLMVLKARNEEAFLLERHGSAYAEYRARTGRFFASLKRGVKVASPDSPPRDRTGGGAEGAHAFLRHDLPGGRLNGFQKAMLLWEQVHPYNAVHAVRLSGPGKPEGLERAIERVCREAGLGEFELDEESDEYRYLPLRGVPLTIHPPSHEPEATLLQVISEQMNTAFPPGPHHPIRWVTFEESGGEAHYIVLTYRHVISDAAGIESLLAAVLAEYLLPASEPGQAIGDTSSAPAARPVIRLAGGPLRNRAGRIRPAGRLWQLVRGLALYFRFRHVHKMPDERDQGDETRALICSLPSGFVQHLSAACKTRGAGLNDAFVAALASAIAAQTPKRKDRNHRHTLAVGTIFSTRKSLPVEERDGFAVHLSDRIIMLPSPDAPIHDLLCQVAASTAPMKQDRRPENGASAMQEFFIRTIWPILDIPNHRRSYRKLLPVCGGVTLFRVDPARFGPAAGRILRYVRAGPPGPAPPLALAPTVFADRLELCLVYRLSSIRAHKAAELLQTLQSRLDELVD